MEKIDLHIHSNLSDGDLNIDELINLAKKNNCNKLSITDHDRIEDYSKFNKDGLTIINGIEFNSSENRMHFLGYGIKNIKNVTYVMETINKRNEEICFELIEWLNKDGYDITYKNVRDYIESIGLNCDILDKRKIVKYLISRGYFDNVLSVYDNLIGKGQKYYIPIIKLSPREIIDLINTNYGVSVLAHPTTLNLSEKDFLIKIRELIEYGLDGIEIINGKMDKQIVKTYQKIADKNNLISTVGSDFHSLNRENLGIEIDQNVFEVLNNTIKSKKLTIF